jgi:hypothetical protein
MAPISKDEATEPENAMASFINEVEKMNRPARA